MSQMYHSIDSILTMLDRKHDITDIKQALADLEAMKGSIKKSTYEGVKALLEDKL